MNNGSATDRKIGMWSATSVAVLGGIYVCVGGVGVLMRPAGLGPLVQVDPFFRGDRQQDILRIAFFTAGLLCLIGVAAPISGHMWLQVSAIVGYAFVLPVACILLARVFAQN